jgi:hypothetical protein
LHGFFDLTTFNLKKIIEAQKKEKERLKKAIEAQKPKK